MITVRFFRRRTQKIQIFKNVVSVVAQLQGTSNAYYNVTQVQFTADRKHREIVEFRVPMKDSYINGVF